MKIFLYLQYLVVLLFWYLYRLVPLRFAYNIGNGLGKTIYSLARFTNRAKITKNNLLITGIAKTHAEAYRIARASWGHFLGHVCEAFRSTGIVTHDNWHNYVELDLSPTAKELLFSANEPVILATGHMGVWEAGIVAISSARPMFAIARLMNNPYLQRFLNKHNFRNGATIISKNKGFTGEAMRQWTQKNGALTILFDQHCRKGAPVTFFGHDVIAFTSPARLHVHTGAALFVGAFLRVGHLKYKLKVVGEPIREVEGATSEEKVNRLTAEMIKRLETIIRDYPEQYLWMHRRWRNVPVPNVPRK